MKVWSGPPLRHVSLIITGASGFFYLTHRSYASLCQFRDKFGLTYGICCSFCPSCLTLHKWMIFEEDWLLLPRLNQPKRYAVPYKCFRRNGPSLVLQFCLLTLITSIARLGQGRHCGRIPFPQHLSRPCRSKNYQSTCFVSFSPATTYESDRSS